MGFFKKQFVLTEPVIKNIRRLVELREPKRKKKPMLFMAKWQICASFVVKALLLAVQAIGSGEVWFNPMLASGMCELDLI